MTPRAKTRRLFEEKTRIPREKVVRTVLYGDVKVSEWELRLLHTPVLQRLYDLKQLGFADRVFPDAVHSRLNHALGVLQVTERMIQSLKETLKEKERRTRREGNKGTSETNSDVGLIEPELEYQADTMRIAALLHDITHIPFGHTLEDEVCLFPTRHENAKRQAYFLNRLVYEFLRGVYNSLSLEGLYAIDINQTDLERRAKSTAYFQAISTAASSGEISHLTHFSDFVTHLRNACSLLVCMYAWDRIEEGQHKGQSYKDPDVSMDEKGILRVGKHLYLNEIIGETPFDPEHDLWQADVLGNTICADLLDYARRDTHFAGLVSQFDDRIYRYLELRRVKDKTRLAIRIYTKKIRLDVLSEILNILKIRYLLSERVLFHPTKCAAGAMLGRAGALIGKSDYEDKYGNVGDRELLVGWLEEAKARLEITAVLTDFIESEGKREFLRRLLRIYGRNGVKEFLTVAVEGWNAQEGRSESSRLPGLISADEEELQTFAPLVRAVRGLARNKLVRSQLHDFVAQLAEDAAGAHRLLQGLLSRQLYKPVFQITRQAAEARRLTGKDLAKQYSRFKNKSILENELEEVLGLSPGTLLVYCPRRQTTLKEARVLVSWSDSEEPIPFNELRLSGIQSFRDEGEAIEEKYRDIWSMYVFVPEALLPFVQIIQRAIRDELIVENNQLLESALLNDPRTKHLSKTIGKVEDVHRLALVNTVKSVSANFGATAREGFPGDFLKLYHQELDALLAVEEQ